MASTDSPPASFHSLATETRCTIYDFTGMLDVELVFRIDRPKNFNAEWRLSYADELVNIPEESKIALACLPALARVDRKISAEVTDYFYSKAHLQVAAQDMTWYSSGLGYDDGKAAPVWRDLNEPCYMDRQLARPLAPADTFKHIRRLTLHVPAFRIVLPEGGVFDEGGPEYLFGCGVRFDLHAQKDGFLKVQVELTERLDKEHSRNAEDFTRETQDELDEFDIDVTEMEKNILDKLGDAMEEGSLDGQSVLKMIGLMREMAEDGLVWPPDVHNRPYWQVRLG